MNYLTFLILSSVLLLTACGGDGSSEPANNPIDTHIDIETTLSDLEKPRLALGFNHSCFISNDKTVKCWGANHLGQLGNGANIVPDEDDFVDDQIEFINSLYSTKPLSVMGVTDVIEISASENHTCALLADHNVKCWGSNLKKQLGNTELSEQGKSASSTAVEVSSLQGLTVKSISVGNAYGCALLEGGSIKCWGGTPNGSATEDLLELTNKTPIQLATGGAHACTVLAGNQIQCWGDISKLGYSESEEKVVTGIDNALLVSSKASHSCALLNTGRVKCWGENIRGQIGNGDGGSASSTVKVPTTNVIQLSQVISLSSGEQYNCAVTRLGQVKCWGSNQHGQLGYISPNNSQPQAFFPESTVAIPTAKDQAKEVSVSQGHSCARLENDDIYCWGKNNIGQLGNGGKLVLDEKKTPQSISSPPVRVKF